MRSYIKSQTYTALVKDEERRLAHDELQKKGLIKYSLADLMAPSTIGQREQNASKIVLSVPVKADSRLRSRLNGAIQKARKNSVDYQSTVKENK